MDSDLPEKEPELPADTGQEKEPEPILPDGVDWTKPLIYWEEMLWLTKYAEKTLQDFARAHPELCTGVNDGRFIFHRDKYIDFVATPEPPKDPKPAVKKKATKKKTAGRRHNPAQPKRSRKKGKTE